MKHFGIVSYNGRDILEAEFEVRFFDSPADILERIWDQKRKHIPAHKNFRSWDLWEFKYEFVIID